jgi:hypothetical protein
LANILFIETVSSLFDLLNFLKLLLSLLKLLLKLFLPSLSMFVEVFLNLAQ